MSAPKQTVAAIIPGLRNRAAGAAIVDELAQQDYGGKGYSCRDPEGHLWWFGSYDPWQPG